MHSNSLILIVDTGDDAGSYLLGKKEEVALEPFVMGNPGEPEGRRRQHVDPA